MMIFNLLILLVMASFLLFAGNRFWLAFLGNRLAPPLPASAARPSLNARRAETLIILAVGIGMILLTCTQHNYSNLFQSLGQIQRPYIIALLSAIVFAIVLISFAALLAWRGKSTGALLLAAAIVTTFATFTDNIAYAGRGIFPARWFDTPIPFTIQATGVDVDGAELWVNNVHLGKLPYHTTLQEFLNKVPQWDNPPADFATDLVDDFPPDVSPAISLQRRRWVQFDSPTITPLFTGAGPASTRPAHESHKYYARVQYDGEWAVDKGGGGTSSNGDGLITRAQSGFQIDFLQRRQRLNQLIDSARAPGFTPDSAALTKLSAFGQDAWLALYTAREKDPALQKIIDAWAQWKYPVDSAATPAAAWSLFSTICADADAAGRYNTLSPTGRAVELLAPRLLPDQLVAKAIALFNQTRDNGYAYGNTTQFGAFQFFSLDTDTVSTPTPPAAFAVAHALLTLHQFQLAQGIYPTIIQSQFIPALLRLDPTGDLNVRIAAYFGGPVATSYLLRQNWQAPESTLPYNQRTFGSPWNGQSHESNKWLYILSQMKNPAAVTFRRQHPEPLLSLADSLTPTFSGEIGEDVDFLFENPDLARRFWPTFSQKIRARSDFSLSTQFTYLIRMNADPALYLETLRATKNQYPGDPAVALQKLAAIPDQTQRTAVVSLLRGYLQSATLPPDITRFARTPEDARQSLLKYLDAAEHPKPTQ